MKKSISIMIAILVFVAVLSGCSSDSPKVFRIGGIPDQNAAVLTDRFDELAQYIAEQSGLEVEYVQSSDYAALVTAFERGDIQLAWFGGLTGVQARQRVAGSQAIAQRPLDEAFKSVFIANRDSAISTLADLKGKRFTFGSESSTSGHLMPRYFLSEAGIVPEEDFNGVPSYSGSHDKTWKLVESGAFDAGALNIAVWQSALAAGRVDTDKVEVFYTTPDYYDYNWTIADVDSEYGAGSKEKVRQALLSFGEAKPEVMALFQDEKFIETTNENYQAIEAVAKELGLIKQ